jgi:hypothetical protein
MPGNLPILFQPLTVVESMISGMSCFECEAALR